MGVRWPPLPVIRENDSQSEVKKILYQAQVDLVKADYAAAAVNLKAAIDDLIETRKRESITNAERDKAAWADEYSQRQSINSAYVEVAKSSVERIITRATFVQNAATAMSGAYVAVLGLSFAVKEHRLPARGVLPTFFLGLAIFLAAAYVSFITKAPPVKPLAPSGTRSVDQDIRRNTFILWTRQIGLQRRRLMQASVVSLGVGILLLPLPYVDMSLWMVLTASGVGLALVIFVPWIVSRSGDRDAEEKERPKAPIDGMNCSVR